MEAGWDMLAGRSYRRTPRLDSPFDQGATTENEGRNMSREQRSRRGFIGHGKQPVFDHALLAVALVCLAFHVVTIAGGELVRREASRMSMGCVYAIVAYGPDEALLSRSLEDALDEVDRIDRLMSHYKPDSPLSRLNAQAADAAVQVDPELFDFIARSIEYSRASDGAFDITVGPLMKAWGLFQGDGRVPTERELLAARRRVGYHHVRLDPAARTIRFDVPGVELDLGGIAKGYAVDRAVDLLRG